MQKSSIMNNSKNTHYTSFIMKALLFVFIFSMGFITNTDAQKVKLTSAQKKTFKDNFKAGTQLMGNETSYSLTDIDERLSDSTLKYFMVCYALDTNNANIN
jgi:hypothetical protein